MKTFADLKRGEIRSGQLGRENLRDDFGVAQSYARTADRAADDALYFAQVLWNRNAVTEAMIVTKRRLDEARKNGDRSSTVRINREMG